MKWPRPRAPLRWPSRRHHQLLAAAGILTCLISLLLPWYRVRFDPSIAESGLGVFGFAEAALLITVGSAAFLLIRVGSGQPPPLPLHQGTLLALAGSWGAVIVTYLIFDRPSITIRGIDFDYGLAYGPFVALGGCVSLVVAGLRLRRMELASERRVRGPRGAEAPAPTAASPPRSQR